MVDFSIPKGTDLPQLTATLSDEIGPIDLTGSTVKLQIRAPGTESTVLLDVAANVVPPASNGRVIYAWQDGDTDLDRGLYVGWFLVDYGLSTLEAPNPQLVFEIT